MNTGVAYNFHTPNMDSERHRQTDRQTTVSCQ